MADHTAAGALLAQLRPAWQVRELTLLAGGYSNDNFRIDTAAHGSFVLRMPRAHVNPFGVDRQREHQLLQWAVANGLALAPDHFDPHTGVAINPYANPGALGDLPRERWPTPTDLGALIQRLHTGVPPQLEDAGQPHGAVAVVARLRSWSTRCAALGRPVDAGLQQRLHRWQAPAAGPVCVCHHDLNPWNVLLAGRHLALLDWELAGFGDARFDLANLVLLFDLPVRAARTFVEVASGGRVALTDLEPWLWLVRVREYLWARLALATGNRRNEIETQHRERGRELGLTGAALSA